MNKLTTKCNQCVFSKKDSCKFNKPVSNNQTDGYCRVKRTSSWFKSLDEKNDAANIVLEEESRLAVVINAHKKTIEQISDTLGSIKHERIKQVIVFVNDYNKEQMAELVKILSFLECKWCVSNFQEECTEELDNLFVADYVLENIEYANWFFLLSAGDRLTQKQIEFVVKVLGYKVNNVLFFYFDHKDVQRGAFNIFAYEELNGSVDIPWPEKITGFSNWKELCYQIP